MVPTKRQIHRDQEDPEQLLSKITFEGSPHTGKLIIGKLSEFIGILTANCCTAILRPFQRCLGANCSKSDDFVAI